jgi:hypothetical protein
MAPSPFDLEFPGAHGNSANIGSEVIRKILSFFTLGAVVWGQSPAAPAAGAQGKTAPHFVLKSRDFYRIGTPVFSFGSAECDARGSVFFNISGFYSVNAILRVKRDGGDPTVIKFPADSGAHVQWHVFVDPSGATYLLLSGVSGHLLIHLSPSGEELDRTDLALSTSFHVHSFSVQPDGKSLFLGSVEKVNAVSNPDPSAHKPTVITDVPSLFWLDTTGKLARSMPFGKEFSRSTTELDVLVAAGKPGIFYVATSSEIKEYGADGDLFRTFPIIAPNKDAQISSLQFVNGHIALVFSYPAKASPVGGESADAESSTTPYFGPLDESWLIANTVSGDMEGFYNAPEGFTGSTLCYLGQRSFLYYTVKDKQPFLMEADQ